MKKLLLTLVATISVSIHAASPAGVWRGTIALPTKPLDIKVSLKETNKQWSGTIDIPAQGVRQMALTDVSVKGNEVRFVMPNVPGNPTFS